MDLPTVLASGLFALVGGGLGSGIYEARWGARSKRASTDEFDRKLVEHRVAHEALRTAAQGINLRIIRAQRALDQLNFSRGMQPHHVDTVGDRLRDAIADLELHYDEHSIFLSELLAGEAASIVRALRRDWIRDHIGVATEGVSKARLQLTLLQRNLRVALGVRVADHAPEDDGGVHAIEDGMSEVLKASRLVCDPEPEPEMLANRSDES